ncbi:MAG: hypothetical protein IT182_01920 [Acidobacteria bacterium]|nr:hypothetical protein [Acidobacteriota bacterium]
MLPPGRACGRTGDARVASRRRAMICQVSRAAGALQLTAGQMSRLEAITPAIGDHHDPPG